MPPNDSHPDRRLIGAGDQVRDEAAACHVALKTIPAQVPMRDHFYGRVLALTKCPAVVNDRFRRGDVLWMVEIANAAASELNPTPEGIYCVRALDGAVLPVFPSK